MIKIGKDLLFTHKDLPKDIVRSTEQSKLLLTAYRYVMDDDDISIPSSNSYMLRFLLMQQYDETCDMIDRYQPHVPICADLCVLRDKLWECFTNLGGGVI